MRVTKAITDLKYQLALECIIKKIFSLLTYCFFVISFFSQGRLFKYFCLLCQNKTPLNYFNMKGNLRR